MISRAFRTRLAPLVRRMTRRRAAVAIMTALSAPVLLGMAGLVTDLTFWYGSHQAMEMAAEAGAMAAASSGQTSTATLRQIAINAANLATNNVYHFTTANLTLALNSEGSTLIVPASSQLKNGGTSPPSQSGNVFSTVTVVATTPALKFFSEILPISNITLAGSATATLRQEINPNVAPSNIYAVTTTGPTEHVSGDMFVPASQTTGQYVTQSPLSQGRSGQLVQGAYYSGSAPTYQSATNTLPDNFAPPCKQLFFQMNNGGSKTTATSTGITSTIWTDPKSGVSTEVYFGPGTVTYSAKRRRGRVVGTYSGTIGAVTVDPTNPLFCANDSSNNPAATCNVPAAAYCGGLDIYPGMTLNYVSVPNGLKNNFLILDGNATLPESGTSNYFTQNPNNVNFAFHFGGSSVGAIVTASQSIVDPYGLSSGVLNFTSTQTTITYYNYNGYVQYADQVCQGAVLPTSLGSGGGSFGTPLCSNVVQTGSGSSVVTSESSSQTNTGNVSGIVTVNFYANEPVKVTDVYSTQVYVINSIPVYTKETENTYFCYNNNSDPCSPTASDYQTSLSTQESGYLPAYQKGKPSLSTVPTCSNGGQSLYSSSTPAGTGFNYTTSSASGTDSQSDTLSVCGQGSPLVSLPYGSTQLIAPTLVANVFLSG
jgi:Flp pilus assembly protein TadG